MTALAVGVASIRCRPYHCDRAKKHLNKACVTDDRFKALATEDEDLSGLWGWFGTEESGVK
jgi:hypothetical protein